MTKNDGILVYKEMLSEYPEVMSVDEACTVLGIGKNSAYSMLNEGIIASVRIGRVYKIPKKSVIDFLLSASGTKYSDEIGA